MCVWRQVIDGKYLNLPLNFTANLKLHCLFKKKDLICFITYIYSRRNTECICKETSHFIEQILKH